MISINEFIENINSLPISDKDKISLLELAKPSFDFSSYLSKKYNITPNEVETLINLQVAGNTDSINLGLESLNTNDYTLIAISRIVKTVVDFAKQEGFPDSEQLELSLKKILILAVEERNIIKSKNIKL